MILLLMKQNLILLFSTKNNKSYCAMVTHFVPKRHFHLILQRYTKRVRKFKINFLPVDKNKFDITLKYKTF